jgi:SepF-like predicted cell division protein (DUF552 family)
MMTVHNPYPDIELVSPIYFHNCRTCYEYPIERMATDIVARIKFEFDPDQDESEGILMYKVKNLRSEHQSNTDQVIKEALKMTRLLVTWKIKHLEEPKVHIVLAEYDNELSIDKLAQLYDKINNTPTDHSPLVWLMCDNTALVTAYELKDLELKITISEGVRNQDNIRAMWINSER